MSSLFTKIIRNEIPSYKVFEDEHTVAFLTIRPLKKGHVLIVPKEEVDHWDDMSALSYQKAWETARDMAKKMKATFSCTRVGVIVAGFEIPHAHINLIPVESEADLSFTNEYEATPEELKEVQQLLRAI
jgi:diadenosine tetraphosphate (Ap4A) HIT family hydrolase